MEILTNDEKPGEILPAELDAILPTEEDARLEEADADLELREAAEELSQVLAEGRC